MGLGSIRLPSRLRWAFPVTVLLHLPAPCFTATLRFQTPSFATGRNVWGLPSSSTPLFLHAMACGSVQTLSVRDSHVEAVPALQGARSSLRPPGYAVYALPLSCSWLRCRHSARDARRDTGRWLALTRQGLAPSQRRQAYLGASTPWFGWGRPVESWVRGGSPLDTNPMGVLIGAPSTPLHRSPTSPYLMTSVAWKRTDGDSVTPRACAVLRLRTSSKRGGRSMGSSSGLAPFRILST